MHNTCIFLIPVGVLLNVACGFIQRQNFEEDTSLSTTTVELLSMFKHCIVFVFDWAYGNGFDNLTSTNYFIFYSKPIRCALVVETYTKYREKAVWNAFFTGPYVPHPLLTKYSTTLINLYSSAATGTEIGATHLNHSTLKHSTHGGPELATENIAGVIRRYNIPFNCVLLFMSNEGLLTANNIGMFSSCVDVSATAVFILISNEQDVHVVGFAHVLQSAHFLFKVDMLPESNIQQLHEKVHSDLQQSQVRVRSVSSGQMCTLGWEALTTLNHCAFSELAEKFNMTDCDDIVNSCLSPSLSYIVKSTLPDSSKRHTRRYRYNMEFSNYLVQKHEFSFICIGETGLKGFTAFVQAFDLLTWIILTAMCTCLTATISLISTNKAAAWWTQIEPSAAVVIMLLFDRYCANTQLQRTATRQTRLVLSLWAFAAMVLGMCYSGNMVSELAAPTLPSVPRDMHELSLVKYKVFTKTTRTVVSKHGRYHKVSLLQHVATQYLKDNPRQTGTLAIDLRRFKAALTYSPTSIPEGQSDDSRSSTVLFAYADKRENVEAIRLRTALTRNQLSALPGGNLDFFYSDRRMALKTNPVLPLFQKFLAKLSESGTYSYWQEKRKAGSVKVWLAPYMRRHNSTTLPQNVVSRLRLAIIWRKFGPLLEGTNFREPIGLDYLRAAVELLVIGLLMSTLVLLNERWPFLLIARMVWRTVGRVL